jgi:hypothetical protein
VTAPDRLASLTCQDCAATFRASVDSVRRGVPARWCPDCRWKHRGRKAIYVATPAADALLREEYSSRRGVPAQLAARLRWPVWRVKRRASELGLTSPPVDRKPWTSAEEAFLEKHAGERLVGWMARKLRRGVTSVALKLKRMKLSRRIREGYTMRDLELCLGVDHREISRWVREGRLQAGRRHGGQAPAFDRDAWTFTDDAVLEFIATNPTGFRLSRVDQVWFLGLLEPVLGRTVAELRRESAA